MLCPIDGAPLVMTDRSGVEIDYCPKCRGVWLDRGELDKIIERAQSQAPAPSYTPSPLPQPGRTPDYLRHSDDDDDDRYKKKRKGGLLGELFDF